MCLFYAYSILSCSAVIQMAAEFNLFWWISKWLVLHISVLGNIGSMCDWQMKYNFSEAGLLKCDVNAFYIFYIDVNILDTFLDMKKLVLVYSSHLKVKVIFLSISKKLCMNLKLKETFWSKHLICVERSYTIIKMTFVYISLSSC